MADLPGRRVYSQGLSGSSDALMCRGLGWCPGVGAPDRARIALGPRGDFADFLRSELVGHSLVFGDSR